jgi:hypothetical protein
MNACPYRFTARDNNRGTYHLRFIPQFITNKQTERYGQTDVCNRHISGRFYTIPDESIDSHDATNFAVFQSQNTEIPLTSM